MPKIDWNEDKNQFLIKNRDVSFENVLECILEGLIISDSLHPNNTNEKNNLTNTFNPFKGLVLDGYEKEIESGIDKSARLSPHPKPNFQKYKLWQKVRLLLPRRIKTSTSESQNLRTKI